MKPKKTFNEIVREVIERSDIILEVLDARFPEKTRNREIEDIAKEQGKKIIYVLNKCDIADRKETEMAKKRLHPCIFVSSTKRLGTTLLLKEIMRWTAGFDKESVYVGVVGYPNTGKSSVINILSGKHAAGTSPKSGYTKGEKLVRLGKNVYLIDTPGVFSYGEIDDAKSLLTAAKDQSKFKDTVEAARKLVKALDGKIERFYGMEKSEDMDMVLEQIALKYKMLRKGGVPDVERMARQIINDWQKGKIK